MEFPGNSGSRKEQFSGAAETVKSGYGLDAKFDAKIEEINQLHENWRSKTGKLRIQSLIEMFNSQTYVDK